MLTDCFVYSNQDDDAKQFKVQRYCLPKGIIKNYNVIINGKNFYEQPIDSNIKRNKEIRKLTTGQGEDYTVGCFLDYEDIKNNYKLIAADSSTQKELDAYPKAIQQIEFVGQLKTAVDAIVAGEYMFNDFRKNQRNQNKFSHESLTVLARVKLTNAQLNKLKSAAKNKTGTTLRITRENFQDEVVPHELLFTIQKTKTEIPSLTTC